MKSLILSLVKNFLRGGLSDLERCEIVFKVKSDAYEAGVAMGKKLMVGSVPSIQFVVESIMQKEMASIWARHDPRELVTKSFYFIEIWQGYCAGMNAGCESSHAQISSSLSSKMEINQ